MAEQAFVAGRRSSKVAGSVFFEHGVAARKWDSLMASGFAMTEIHFKDSAGRIGKIDAWGKVTWPPEPTLLD